MAKRQNFMTNIRKKTRVNLIGKFPRKIKKKLPRATDSKKWKIESRRHIKKRRRIRKAKNRWSWYSKLYSQGDRQFRFLEK